MSSFDFVCVNYFQIRHVGLAFYDLRNLTGVDFDYFCPYGAGTQTAASAREWTASAGPAATVPTRQVLAAKRHDEFGCKGANNDGLTSCREHLRFDT